MLEPGIVHSDRNLTPMLTYMCLSTVCEDKVMMFWESPNQEMILMVHKLVLVYSSIGKTKVSISTASRRVM